MNQLIVDIPSDWPPDILSRAFTSVSASNGVGGNEEHLDVILNNTGGRVCERREIRLRQRETMQKVQKNPRLTNHYIHLGRLPRPARPQSGA
jgi:hypothetical protein